MATGMIPDTPAVYRGPNSWIEFSAWLRDEFADAYGTWAEKRNYGKTYWGVQRSTFIIDPEGTIAHVIEKASPKTHDDEVLRALADTQATAT